MEFLKKHFVAIFFFVALFAATIFLPDSFIEGSIEALKNHYEEGKPLQFDPIKLGM